MGSKCEDEHVPLERIGLGSRPAVRRWAALLAGLWAWVAAAAIPAAELPQAFRAEYVVRYLGAEVGEVTVALRPLDDGEHLLAVEGRTTGGFGTLLPVTWTESSLWTLQDARPVPLRFRSQLSSEPEKAIDARFDWAGKTARVDNGGKRRNVALTAGVLDRTLAFLSIGRDVAAGRDAFEYPVLEKNRVKRYGGKVIGREAIDTAVGRIETVKVDGQGTRPTTIWVAPGSGFLPVRMHHEAKIGGQVEVELRRLRWTPAQRADAVPGDGAGAPAAAAQDAGG
jgi:hypothetical protein